MTSNKQYIMKRFLSYIPSTAAFFFILLFCYAALSKAMDFENFQVQIGQSPLLSAYASWVSYAVILLELLIVLLLIVPKTKLLGLYSATALMSAFTVYIFLILNYSDFVPCSCGGILEKLGWKEHLIFNIACVILGTTAVYVLERNQRATYQKTLILLITSNIFATALVIGLFIQSDYIIKHANNFTRRFLLHPVLEKQTLTLENEYYYFAGEDEQYIYLGNQQYPQMLTTISKDLKTKNTIKITPKDFQYPFKNVRVTVKKPYYYLSDGTVPIIFRGKLGDPNAQRISYQDAYFSQIVVKDSVDFIIRTFNRKNKDLTLASLSLDKVPKIQFYPEIIQKQKDGVFDSDGQLTLSTHPYKVVYLYNYRNQFTVADHNLTIENKLRTIDTIETAHIKSKRLSDGRHKMIAPALKVNEKISAISNLAFIQSALKGKNESASDWKKAKVIDIYRLDKKEYIGSFYLYHNGDKSTHDYWAGQSNFYALVGKKLISYSYRQPLTEFLKTGEAENLNPE